MRYRSLIAALASLGLGVSAMGLAPAAGAATPSTVVQSSSKLAASTKAVSATPASAAVDFSVGLQLSDPDGALALEQSVSDPSSPSYRHYLSAKQWESRYSPTQASVDAVTAWMRSQGITVESVTPDRMTVEATASAATVSRAFGTSLKEYRHAGKLVRLAAAPLAVPSEIAPLITGVTGVDQNYATPDHPTRSDVAHAQPSKKGEELPQPFGFRNAKPCSKTYGQKLDTTDPAFSDYPSPLPYAVCGYKPPQLQGAYGLTSQIKKGIDGKGETVAIVDAYVSPTLFADSQEYSQKNQRKQVLESAQFSEHDSSTFNQIELCEASEWFGEQTLDVEAVHATAPGANILYVGAKNCVNGLYASVQEIVDGELANVITDSWGDDGGDLLDSAGSRRGFDNILLMAAGTGIGVQFSAGDEGDEFAHLGMTVADYPSSSPFATAVGGTSLQVGKGNARIGELGWSTARSVLCTPAVEATEFPGCVPSSVNTWLPPSGEYLYGGGGGTSYEYPEPPYQVGIVPAELAERNSAITGIANRVEPDVSMDADPTTGMLVGETQQFPNGTYYDQYRIGGTSLASPLFAGVMADADQAAGVGNEIGFANPALYAVAESAAASSAFDDIVPGGLQADVRQDYIDETDKKEGLKTTVRVLDYEGREEFCSGTGNCTRQKVALNTAPGFDSMTGIGSPGAGLIEALATP